MSAFNTIVSLHAAAEASEAASEARKARDAAESVVDAQAKFIEIPVAKFEEIEVPGWFTSNKYKLIGEKKRMSIKNTDVSKVKESVDDFGNKYATLVMEERYHSDEDETYEETIDLNLSLRDATAIVNLEAKLP
jgi:hypothetical protein